MAQYDGAVNVPATICAISDAIRRAEQILTEIDRRMAGEVNEPGVNGCALLEPAGEDPGRRAYCDERIDNLKRALVPAADDVTRLQSRLADWQAQLASFPMEQLNREIVLKKL